MDRYVQEIRPKLLKGHASRRLWISESGGDLRPETIHAQVKKVTRRYTRRAVGPHLFRHCAATSIAETAPELAHIIQYVLGHTTSMTSDHHYKRVNSIEASRRLAAATRLYS
jgi:integrase/recombinase XerD